jgi:methyltransferase family protein
MPKLLFRVKRYAHPKYKFLVRGKVRGKWKRRYFISEDEAIAFAEQQNAMNGKRGRGSTRNNVATASPAATHPRSPSSADFATLVTPTYLGPRIERYLGDSWSMHLPFAYDLMRDLAPKMFVELGVKQGESYFSFCQSAAENQINVQCYGVDSWRGDIQTGELDPEIEKEVAEYNWRYSSFSELKVMLFSEALADFVDGTIDLLHIDGTHTYEDVKTDFESWLPKLSPNGIILFHDVMLRDRAFGVWKLWEEIAREDNSFLFEFGYGLGIWKKQRASPNDSPFIRRLMTANEVEKRDINHFYANAAAALALWENSHKRADAETAVSNLQQERSVHAAQIADLQSENEGKTRQIADLQHALEEKTRQNLELQRNREESAAQVLHFKNEAEERTRHVNLLQSENEEKTKQVFHFKNEAENKATQAAQFKIETEDKTKRVVELQHALAAKLEQVGQFQREADNRLHELRRLQDQIERQTGLLRRADDAALDVRWEALSLRKSTLLRDRSLDAVSSRLAELQSQIQALENERAHSRENVSGLLADLDEQRQSARQQLAKIKATHEKQFNRLRKLTSRKVILPFGSRQKRIREILG